MLITAAAATFAATFLATLAILWPKTQRETLMPMRPLRRAHRVPASLYGLVRPSTIVYRIVSPDPVPKDDYWVDNEVENDPVYEDGVLVGYKRR